MPLDRDLVEPARTAVLVSECQRMTVGDRSTLPALVDAAAGVIPVIARLVESARCAGVQVVHGIIDRRPDGKGTSNNTRFAGMIQKQRRAGVVPDPAGVEIVDQISVDPADLVISRLHGMTPFTDTGMDTVLRNLGVSTIVATGVSLNVALAGTVVSAVDRGYHVVVPTDAVTGVPPEYGRAMLENTYSMLAWLTTADELMRIWAR